LYKKKTEISASICNVLNSIVAYFRGEGGGEGAGEGWIRCLAVRDLRTSWKSFLSYPGLPVASVHTVWNCPSVKGDISVFGFNIILHFSF